MRDCTIWIRNKSDNQPYAGLLQPLPVPQRIWQEVSMDFIEGLPRSEGKDLVMVVIDRFSKYGHFIPLAHPFTVTEVARSFFDTVYKLHGLPERIISDRDPIFTSGVWRELFGMLGTKLHMSSAYHPQTDGQTERLNRCLETYLRCLCFQRPRTWHKWITHAEWWYNTAFHSALGATPFQALYGQAPPNYLTANLEVGASEGVQEWGREREEVMKELRENLLKAQNRMKQVADKHRIDREFQIGDHVFLKLQPYRQSTIARRSNLKLSSRFYGPFEVLEKIGPVAYRLRLPEGSKVHPVFHVYVLKRSPPEGVPASDAAPTTGDEGQPLAELREILDRRLVRRGNKAITQVKVSWSNLPEDRTTWEDYWVLREQFPNLDP